MVKKSLIGLGLILFFSSTLFGMRISGITMPETLKSGGDTLVLNGAGQRTKFFIDAYVSGLYLKQKNRSAAAIINAEEKMAIRLHITSSLISGKRMAEATNDGFNKSTNGKTASLRSRIDRFISVFKAGIKKGDAYNIIYFPGTGIKVYKNGEYKLTVKGKDMKRALFGIWIGQKPPTSKLKKQMLGS